MDEIIVWVNYPTSYLVEEYSLHTKLTLRVDA